MRTPQIYSTTTFPLDGSTYYWRIKIWDQYGGEGEWSAGNNYFTMRPPATTLQDLNYTYDAVGNIIGILDHSGNNSAASTTYTYDALYRLTRASTTDAVVSDWLETYSYDNLGNMLSKSDVGSYTYAGTGFANPHAPTTINSVVYSYDRSGNVTNYGTTNLAWNYRNRLTDINNSGTTTHYFYDEADQRVEQDIKRGALATTTTKYYSSLYETTGATTTLYVYAFGQLLATVEGNGAATSTYIAHTDHQGSVQVMSDKNGTLAQLATTYPFGEPRNDEHPANFDESRKFLGQYYDRPTSLSYLNARYYNGNNGQFLSQDPILRGVPGLKFLTSPQSLNYYAYSSNNPINRSDPSGLFDVKTGMVQKGDTAGSIAGQLTASYGPQYGATFTGSGLTSFNGGKAPVVGSYYGFSIDIGRPGAAGSIGGGYSSGGGYAPSSAPVAEALVFQGNSLNYYNTYQPELNRSWAGVSGRGAGWSPLPHKADPPITPGIWGVDPSRTEYFNDLPWYQKTASEVGRGLWPGGLSSWGEVRTELSNKTPGQEKEYSTYYIHGGDVPGSRGCIDLTYRDTAFHGWLTQTLNRPIDLYVPN